MKYLILALLLIASQSFAVNKSICGSCDDRILSYNPKVGRGLLSPRAKDACTFTMISSSCAISAGHCSGYSKIVEFNTPLSNSSGWLVRSGPKDVYGRDKLFGQDARGPGMDFLVVKLKANKLTGLLPGDAQGHYPISFAPVEIGLPLVVYGYGTSKVAQQNFAQQVSRGPITGIERLYKAAEHRVDTTSGNSGSAMINDITGEIIGVHTHGGCIDSDNFPRSSNYGTLFSQNEKFRTAVVNCLKN